MAMGPPIILSYLARLFSPENLPNIALVVTGIVASIIALCALRFIRDQTISGRDAARAALLNAQAVIKSERPWLMVRIIKCEPEHSCRRIPISSKFSMPVERQPNS